MRSPVLILAILILILSNCRNDATNYSRAPKDLPAYSIHDEDIFDAAAKAQITLDVIIEEEEIDEQKIRRLLSFLYEKTITRRGFQFYDHPTNIFIYVYTSKEKAESSMGMWIGMISIVYDDTEPKIEISNTQLNSLSEVKEIKWGIAYSQRKEIWMKKNQSEDKAQKEANQNYPLDKPDLTFDDIGNHQDYYMQLRQEYKSELAKEFSINETIIDSIVSEGFKMGWAFPPRLESN